MPFSAIFSNRKTKYAILSLFSLAGIGFCIFSVIPTPFAGLLGVLSTTALLITLGIMLKNTEYFTPLPCPLVWSTLLISLGIMLGNVAVYFFYQITPITILAIFTLFLLLTLFAPDKNKKNTLIIDNLKNRLNFNYNFNYTDLLAIIILLTQISMIFKLFKKSTDLLLASPWLVIGKNFFILYAITLFLLFLYLYLSKTKKTVFSLILIIVQYLITFGVAAAIYQLGYGYDPFLHRATESHILQNGFILPKTPFYLGQYILVILTTYITHLPLKLIDIWLVPMLASIFLPLSAFFGMKYGFKLSNRWAGIATLIIPLYPLNTMFATTPHNLANLLLLSFILIAPAYLYYKQLLPVLLIISLFAVAIHPLSGIFALWLLLSLVFIKNKRWLLFAICLLTGTIIIPIFLFLFFYLQNGSLEFFTLTKDGLSAFANLFKDPYYFIYRDANWVIESIYIYRVLIPVILIITALIGIVKCQEKKLWLLPAFSLIILINTFFVSAGINFPNLNDFEKIQYAERLRHLILFFLLPLTAYTLVKLGRRIANYKLSLFIVYSAGLAIMLTGSWYLTYPQRNERVHFPGYNITSADMETAKFIHDNAGTEKDYIVLSNILTSAAAIDQYGFARYYDTSEGQTFYYSIPTGGILYTQYNKMLYQGQKREFMQEAMDMTNTKSAYFVISSYWADADKIIAGAKKTANSWQMIDGGKVWVFGYYSQE